jgi:hypothetical protein
MRTKIKLGNSSSQIQIVLGNKSPSTFFCNGTVLIPVNYLGDPPGGHALSEMSEGIMSREFDGLDATEKAGIGTALNRCRALATKIANELRNRRPEHFIDKLSLADVHASLERAADVLSTVKGSQARGRQYHR